MFLLFTVVAQAQSANLDQGANGKASAPTTPVDWVNGNLNGNTAHFLEGYSVPYRAVLKSLVVNQTYTLVVALDVRNGSKHALDYITQFQRLEPHITFGHTAETVNPILNVTGFPAAYFTSTDTEPIPVPSTAGTPVAGQPAASFNALPAAERVMTGYNADLLSVTYASEGNLTAAQSETVINITFKALKETVVLAWGGHIASEAEWGSDPVTGESNSASGINGSPYHMRLKNWIINGNVVSIGNQDRSLKTDAVLVPPECEVAGPDRVCAEFSPLLYTSTVDDAQGVTYLWSIIGANTAGAQIVNATLANIEVVPIGSTFNAGSFNLQLIVTRNGLKDTCYLGTHESPGTPVVVQKASVDAGTDQAITNLDTAYLNAVPSGGTAPYTFSWSPATGLSATNIANPYFVPPSAGVYQFIVTITDSIGCMDKDTVVITVTEHAHPPCVIDGPDPVCPGTSNVYTGPPPADVSSYSWSVTGNASIPGATNGSSVTVLAGSSCGAYVLQLITATPDGKVKDTCMRTIQVKDTIPPVLAGTVADATVACAKDVPAAPAVTASDNCQAEMQVQMSQETTDSTCVNKFKIVRKWWAVDACGNTSDTLRQTITVNDDVKPVITAEFEKEISVQCVNDIPAPPTPTATDNCDGELTPVYSAIGSGTACDSTIVRTWVFTDACGNADSVKQTIHVKDDTAPVLNGNVSDATVACAKDVPAAPTVTATDNCGDVTVQYSQMVTDSTCVNKFKVVRMWWTEDACGNKSDTLRQTITVNDDVKPVITADFEREITVQCEDGIPEPPTPTATDNCDGALTPVYSSISNGTGCDLGIVRKWIFTDACGNSDSVTQIIHVKDNTKPVLNGSVTDATVACAKDVPAAANITATDNCGEATVHYSEEVTDSTCVNRFKVVRMWWAEDACGNKSDTLRQTITVYDDVKPVITADFDKEISVQCEKDIPAPPSPTATDNCDGNLTPVCSATRTGSGCDLTIVRTWVFTDACGNSDSVKQTIHVKDNIAPVLDGNVSDVTVACAKDVPAAGNVTATDNCGDATVHYSQTVTDSTCVNRFKVVRMWWAEDACGNKSDTLYQTVTVFDDVAPVVVTKADNKLLACGVQVTFDPPTFEDNCGGTVTVTTSDRREGSACPFVHIRRWTATDECGNSTYVEQAVTVSCCDSYCTYTQGFYGNKGGLGCTPGGTSVTAKVMMTTVMDAQVGDSAVFGLTSTGKFFTLFLANITSDDIFKMLPGGGTPAALKGYATFTKTNTWANVPISTAKSTYGKINNVLLSQTMALFFNMGVTTSLSGLAIQGDSLFTAKVTACGSTTPVSKIDTFTLPKNVVAYLTSTGQATVQGLFDLANKYLGGQTVSGITASDVNAAVDAINRGFDKCAVLVGWASSSNNINLSAGNITTLSVSRQAAATTTADEAKMKVTVFPNPYSDVLIFKYVAPQTGMAELTLYNLMGQRMATVQKANVIKGSAQHIQYQVPEYMRVFLIYKLTVGNASASGKVVPIK
ncbi:hypothetical protein EGT74_17450 [Chitinophaga lutea]|uniref:T9SS C-terminal target domain-containing protein n=1 Tax=Chitinophaga lutea TaxID=2488634 RepID=A0A3N4PM00_9BACT|nr:hypothetical protein [Chitinophaga lutea]RPE08815.1 hypothetical protein EGT74_17450 [Chitinophaga lutea]